MKLANSETEALLDSLYLNKPQGCEVQHNGTVYVRHYYLRFTNPTHSHLSTIEQWWEIVN